MLSECSNCLLFDICALFAFIGLVKLTTEEYVDVHFIYGYWKVIKERTKVSESQNVL